MKSILYILTILLLLTSCKGSTKNNKTNEQDNAISLSCGEEAMQRVSDEFEKFDTIIIKLYNQIETNPIKVLDESEKLIKKTKTNADPYNLRWNKLSSLYALRAETFYKTKEYKKSITEIFNDVKNSQETLGGDLYIGDNSAIHLACNYVKLKDFKKAKYYLDKANSGWYITDYVYANYYEVIGSKTKAITAYNEILKKDDLDHYYFYKDAQKRMIELTKTNPKLLNELFYPSDRSDNEICKTDNDRRTKIFELISNLPEIKDDYLGVGIYNEPRHTNGKYWIKVLRKNNSELFFSVDTINLEIKYLDLKNKKEISLDDWRKNNK